MKHKDIVCFAIFLNAEFGKHLVFSKIEAFICYVAVSSPSTYNNSTAIQLAATYHILKAMPS